MPTDLRRAAVSVLLSLSTALAADAQPVPRANPDAGPTAYVGGRWYDGEGFAARDTVWADGGVFVPGPLRSARVVGLEGAYVVPPFGDAHYHGLDGPDGLASADSQFVAQGIFYVQNPNNRRSGRDRIRDVGTTVDVVYANGGITAPGAHPVPAYERQALGLTIQQMWDRADELRASRVLEGDAYHLAATVADLDAVWPTVLAGRPDVVKVYLSGSEEWAEGAPERPLGLDPAVVLEVVRRAHAAGLRVLAHVETAADARAALEAGVDGLAHVPGYSASGAPVARYVMDDALVADLAARGVPVTPTLARGPAQLPFVPERYRPSEEEQAVSRRFHRDLFRRLAEAGVPLALGADMGGLTVLDEASYAVEIGGLTPAQALHALSVDTPRAVFPDRAIGALEAGFEASLLALECSPLQDWACTGRIAHREKRGRALETGALAASLSETAAAWRALEVGRFTAPSGPADDPLLAGLKALTRGDLEAATALLRLALEAAPDSLRPFVRARLADTAAERFDWAESVRLRAIDDPSVLTSTTAGFGRFPRPRLALETAETTVPFDGLRVPAAVNGAAVRAIVDTGARNTSVSRALVERLGLRVDTTARGRSVVPSLGLAFDTYAVLVDSVTVGEATFYDVPATVAWREDGAADGDEIFLGASLLRHLAGAVRYDYAAGTFTVVRDALEAEGPPHFVIEPGTGAPAVAVEVGGQPAVAVVDTGNQAPVYLTEGAFDVPEAAYVRTDSGTLESGYEWSHRIYQLPLVVPGHPALEAEAYQAGYIFSAGDPVSVILGATVWDGGTLTLDLRNRRVRFERSALEDEPVDGSAH